MVLSDIYEDLIKSPLSYYMMHSSMADDTRLMAQLEITQTLLYDITLHAGSVVKEGNINL